MKNLEKSIILALHPECKTWEEAIEKELKIVEITNGDLCFINNFWQSYNHLNHHYELLDDLEKEDYILPISLPRVMQALRKINHKSMGSIYVDEFGKIGYHTIGRNKKICDWKLTDDNGKDLNLEDQTEETREALNKLFNV